MSEAIARGLDRAYAGAAAETLDLATARVVVFSDHHRGAIEIAEGEIRLVRWPDREGRPRPLVLQRMALAEALRPA